MVQATVRSWSICRKSKDTVFHLLQVVMISAAVGFRVDCEQNPSEGAAAIMEQFIGCDAHKKFSVFVAVNEKGHAGEALRVSYDRQPYRGSWRGYQRRQT